MDIHYEFASRTAAHIVNCLPADLPPAERFGRILALILAAMREAQAELDESRFLPSEN